MNVRPAARLVLMLLALLLAGCVSNPQYSFDTDPQANFANYRSFGFYAPLAAEDKGYSTPSTKAMRAAARREMEARGYVYNESAPDLLVNINAFITERTDVVDYGGYMGYGYGYYGYRGGYYGYPGFWGGDTYVRNYKEGTLNIDLVDARGKNLVWEGIAVGRLSNLKSIDRTARINTTIAEIFAYFPHRAGGG